MVEWWKNTRCGCWSRGKVKGKVKQLIRAVLLTLLAVDMNCKMIGISFFKDYKIIRDELIFNLFHRSGLVLLLSGACFLGDLLRIRNETLIIYAQGLLLIYCDICIVLWWDIILLYWLLLLVIELDDLINFVAHLSRGHRLLVYVVASGARTHGQVRRSLRSMDVVHLLGLRWLPCTVLLLWVCLQRMLPLISLILVALWCICRRLHHSARLEVLPNRLIRQLSSVW